ncbi:predicted protein [Methanosarcina acetivorans C2A]|uniref:Uncharacterized protein n=1 Tax=Methanosarcina acetivorans (strain ATCC 35395 / DSM 2834 / JCM 12185 / C2A) TaxID=188937 RepID=Q8TI09_METAC|nr:predicted protein [Methanosarcina acetivorans C2A]
MEIFSGRQCYGEGYTHPDPFDLKSLKAEPATLEELSMRHYGDESKEALQGEDERKQLHWYGSCSPYVTAPGSFCIARLNTASSADLCRVACFLFVNK